MSSNEFRKIMNTLENLTEGRAVTGGRGGWVAGQHISHDPIPFTDRAPERGDSNWMKRVVFGDNFKDKMTPLYLDPANNRFQFIGGWSDGERAYVYFPNNTAKTLGKVQAAGIRKLFADKGMKEGTDYVLDQQHELLKIFKDSDIPRSR
jgi:hypothetical protein